MQAMPGGVGPSAFALHAQLNGVGARLGVNQHFLRGLVDDVAGAWADYRAGEKGRPKRKGQRNRLFSLPFKSGVKLLDAKHLRIPSFGVVRLHDQKDLPALCGLEVGVNRIKCARLMRVRRGWYLTLFIDAPPRTVTVVDHAVVGVDLGYSTLAMLSSGEKIPHPREYQRAERRIGQAARGLNLALLGALQQRLANARRHRNHEISRDLVARHATIYLSKDNLKGLQRTFGKSVLSAGHGELRGMLASKSRQAGRVYVEVSSKQSTRRCHCCGALSGPHGVAGLSVRVWECVACGARHDRDVNAACNALLTGIGSMPQPGAVLALETAGNG
ncbi:MAG: hypothetical protein C0497_03910 [Gemmatimonas sp.]|nr:hypothetical protein [Gemmatimonas sp.]